MSNDPRHKIKIWLHTCAFILMAGVMGCALIILSNPVTLGGIPRTPLSARAGMSMAGKGLLFLTYQILTENVHWFKRAASTKANKILNCIESVAWGAATGVTVYSIMQFCVGISCTLSYVMIILCAFLCIISVFSARISIVEHRHFKQTGIKPGDMKLETIKSEASRESSHRNTDSGISTVQPDPVKSPEHAYYQPRGASVPSPAFRGTETSTLNRSPRNPPEQIQAYQVHHSRRSNEHHSSQTQHRGQSHQHHSGRSNEHYSAQSQHHDQLDSHHHNSQQHSWPQQQQQYPRQQPPYNQSQNYNQQEQPYYPTLR